MSRTAHRLFSSSLRSPTRASLNTAARSPRTALIRRTMSSESHAGHGSTSSDRPWIIGSALVFGPLFLYLVSPSARKGSHVHTDHGHNAHHDEREVKHIQNVESHQEEGVKPFADDQSTEVSVQGVTESMEKAFDARKPEEVVAKANTAAVEENLAAEAQPLSEPSTDAEPIPESDSNSTSAPVAVDEATSATGDENVQTTASNTSDDAVETKA
ncbi:hypothetical protein HD554DRAFT_919957 [Boletus coccyginus]|nr:hypothetical protein HD554DRAFT_919957 [Boletus coccyginus]